MSFKKFYKRVRKRYASDSILTFGFRIIFFLFRKCLEAYDMITFRILKLKYRSEKDYIMKKIHGSKMYLSLKDKGISRDLILAGTREPTHTKLMQDVLKPGDVVVDIGANIGYYALMEARAVGKAGQVYAIEPVPANMAMLKRNIKLNGYKNIKTFALAIGGGNKKEYIYLATKSNLSTLTKNESDKMDLRIKDKVPVQVVTLDTFLKDKKFPDVIRMDVEGYETEIIKGMKSILTRLRPLKIFMELHCCLLPDLGLGILREFEESGFKMKKFFRDRSPLMLNKNRKTKKMYYYLGKKINGVYEFMLEDIITYDLKKIAKILREETFHAYLVRR